MYCQMLTTSSLEAQILFLQGKPVKITMDLLNRQNVFADQRVVARHIVKHNKQKRRYVCLCLYSVTLVGGFHEKKVIYVIIERLR